MILSGGLKTYAPIPVCVHVPAHVRVSIADTKVGYGQDLGTRSSSALERFYHHSEGRSDSAAGRQTKQAGPLRPAGTNAAVATFLPLYALVQRVSHIRSVGKLFGRTRHNRAI